MASADREAHSESAGRSGSLKTDFAFRREAELMADSLFILPMLPDRDDLADCIVAPPPLIM